jgi:hypothetical protein
MFTPIIVLPPDFLSTILATVSQLITDLGGYLALVIGVLLGGILLEIIVGAIRNR